MVGQGAAGSSGTEWEEERTEQRIVLRQDCRGEKEAARMTKEVLHMKIALDMLLV